MTVMHCDEFVELVTEFLEGAMDAAEEERFVAHLADCDGCGAYLDQLRQTIGALHDRSPAPGLPAATRRALLAEFRARHDL